MLWVVEIWQVSSMQKIYAASWNLFTLTAEADRGFCQLVMFFTVFFHWMHKMKYNCYQQPSVIHGWFVYSIFGWEMLSKFEIRFRMTWLSSFTLLDAGFYLYKKPRPAIIWAQIQRGYYLAARRYEISLRMLKNISRVSVRNEWNIFSTREEKFRFSKWPCNVLFNISIDLARVKSEALFNTFIIYIKQ